MDKQLIQSRSGSYFLFRLHMFVVLCVLMTVISKLNSKKITLFI